MMGKCRSVEGYDCSQIRSTELKYIGCNNKASRCAAYDTATKTNPEIDVVQYCKYTGCKYDGKQWIYKEENGDEYYYYPDTGKCHDYVNKKWSEVY